MIEKATELGVSAIQPVTTKRTQTDKVRLERFEAIAREAAEQTERLDLPQIAPLQMLDVVLDVWDANRCLIYADEAGDDAEAPWGGETGRAPIALAALQGLAPPLAVLIGPEGGFDPRERERLRAADFVIPVSLGPRILRAETASIALLTMVQAVCGDWR